MDEQPELLKPPFPEVVGHVARGIAMASAGFCLVLGALLVVHFLQLRAADPLDNRARQALEAKLRENPGDDNLREEIRALDLLARRALFTSGWQLRSGAWMLGGGIAVLLIALQVHRRMHRAAPEMPTGRPPDPWRRAARARRGLAAFGGAVAVLLVVAGLLIRQPSLGGSPSGAGISPPGGLPTAAEYARNWPNFRGPGANGIATAKAAPVSWDGRSGRGLLWKAEVPLPGFSSPVVWEEQVFITGADEQQRMVFCFSGRDGRLLWQTAVASRQESPGVHRDTGFAAPSMATNGRQVFAIFATGDLAGLDLDGQIRWTRNLGLPDNHYGHSSSLLTFENLLIVQYDQNSNGQLLGLDAATGQTVWRAPRPSISWSSPICVHTGSRYELILTDGKGVTAYDPRTGARWWGENCLAGEMGPSAAYADGMVFVTNDFAATSGLRLGDNRAKVEWRSEEPLPDTASPLATGSRVYLATSRGVIACLAAATGKVLWEQEFDDGFYASPVLVGDRVYALDLQGIMHIFRDADHYQSLGEPALGEPSSCTPAVREGRFYLRGDRYLYCVTGG